MAKKLEIYLNGFHMGNFVSTNYEFPSVAGNFTRLPIPDQHLESLIDAYIAYSIKSYEIGEPEEFGEAWEEFMFAHENEHLYLINEAKWQAKNEMGEMFEITIPVFDSENIIHFR